jgi:hypothetical protein
MTLKNPVVREFPKAKNRVLIVLGYSEMLAGKLTPDLIKYLERVGNYPHLTQLQAPRSKVSFVVPCGGHTREKSAPALTEADVMVSILCAHYRGTIPIFPERDSLTTSQNLRNARKIILRSSISPESDELVVFCKATYALKIKFLMNKYFPEYTFYLETFDMGDESPLRVLAGTTFDICSEYFPPLSWLGNILIRMKVRSA